MEAEVMTSNRPPRAVNLVATWDPGCRNPEMEVRQTPGEGPSIVNSQMILGARLQVRLSHAGHMDTHTAFGENGGHRAGQEWIAAPILRVGTTTPMVGMVGHSIHIDSTGGMPRNLGVLRRDANDQRQDGAFPPRDESRLQLARVMCPSRCSTHKAC